MRKFLSNPKKLAVTIILGLCMFHVFLWMGRMFLPGFVGELCGKMQGLAFTPFFMEFFLIAFGFLVILIINHFRMKWEGSELVYMETVQDPPSSLDSKSRSIILSERQQHEDRMNVILAALEGSITVKDFSQANELANEASEIDPHNKMLILLKEKINQSQS